MLSHLNTLIGFAAVFAIFSLFVTSISQIVRSLWRLKTRSLIETLTRLFGELKDTRRFVAAILSHPSLEGSRGMSYYHTLINPAAKPEQVKAAADVVLGEKDPKILKIPWPRTNDLDKQTVKDIGQTVYEQIGELVDHPLTPDGLPVTNWAARLKEALENADKKHLETLVAAPANAPAQPPTVVPHGTAVQPFRGRMWMLAAAAFPEAEGKAPPLKTYVAAFHDEADASSSDSFTWRMRAVTVVISVLLAFLLQIDALAIWKRMALADPAQIEALQKSAQSLAPQAGAGGAAAGNPDLSKTRQDLLNEIDALRSSQFDLGIRPGWRWLFERNGEPVFGFLLAVAALSLGAPFWFELLKSTIQLKSAFTKPDRK